MKKDRSNFVNTGQEIAELAYLDLTQGIHFCTAHIYLPQRDSKTVQDDPHQSEEKSHILVTGSLTCIKLL